MADLQLQSQSKVFATVAAKSQKLVFAGCRVPQAHCGKGQEQTVAAITQDLGFNVGTL